MATQPLRQPIWCIKTLCVDILETHIMCRTEELIADLLLPGKQIATIMSFQLDRTSRDVGAQAEAVFAQRVLMLAKIGPLDFRMATTPADNLGVQLQIQINVVTTPLELQEPVPHTTKTRIYRNKKV